MIATADGTNAYELPPRRARPALRLLTVMMLGFLAGLLALQLDLPGWPPAARADTPALQRVTLFDLPVTSGANIITQSITVSDLRKPATEFRITCLIKGGATDADLQPVIICDGVELAGDLNSGTDLVAGSWYTFGLGIPLKTTEPTPRTLSLNLRCGASTTLAYLDIQEVQVP